MDVLPPYIAVLNSDGRRAGSRLERVTTQWSEADWDRVIVENADLLAECFREARVIEDDSMLRVLGTQVDSVDVVLAEVEATEEQALRRLVLVEDKLLRSPHAKRNVLAQILEYAHRVQSDWPTADLAEKLRGGGHSVEQSRRWVEENENDLKRTIRKADFLLVIAGDGIDEGMEKLARRFTAHDDPLSLSELALVSMPVYRLDAQYLLVPHVVSAVQRNQREVTINITVQDIHGREVAASATMVDSNREPTDKRLPVRDEVVAFLRRMLRLIDGAWPGVALTKNPRKSVDMWQTAPDGAAASCKIHFGGYRRDVWSPILVGASVTAKDTLGRDRWADRLRARLADLPTETSITFGGPRTLEALKPISWNSAEDLTSSLAASLAADFKRVAAVVKEEMIRLADSATQGSGAAIGADDGGELHDRQSPADVSRPSEG